jgi:WD40 repeat protein
MTRVISILLLTALSVRLGLAQEQEKGVRFRVSADLVHARAEAFDFSPDGKILATGGKEIILWDVAAGKEAAQISLGEGPVYALRFLSAKELLAADLLGFYSYDLATKKVNWAARYGTATFFSETMFSEDGKWLLAYKAIGQIAVYSVEERKQRGATWKARKVIRNMALSPQGNLVAVETRPLSGEESSCLIYDVDASKVIFEKKLGLEDGKRSIKVIGLQFSEDGQSMLVATNNGKVSAVDVKSFKEETKIEIDLGKEEGLTRLLDERVAAWSPDRTMLAIVNLRKIQVYDVKSGKKSLDVATPLLSKKLRFSRDNKRLAVLWTPDEDTTVRQWDMKVLGLK